MAATFRIIVRLWLLIVGRDLAIEIESSQQVQNKHLKGIRRLGEENLGLKLLVVSLDVRKRALNNGILVYPWQEFLQELWRDELI